MRDVFPGQNQFYTRTGKRIGDRANFERASRGLRAQNEAVQTALNLDVIGVLPLPCNKAFVFLRGNYRQLFAVQIFPCGCHIRPVS